MKNIRLRVVNDTLLVHQNIYDLRRNKLYDDIVFYEEKIYHFMHYSMWMLMREYLLIKTTDIG